MLMRLRGTLRAATADATAVHTLPQIAVKADVTDTATIRASIDSLNLRRCPTDAADLADVELSYATTDQQARLSACIRSSELQPCPQPPSRASISSIS